MTTTLTAPPPPLQPAPLLQLNLQYEPEALNRVKQHWHVTFSRQRKVSVLAKRILARVLEQIKEDDEQLREFYQLRVSSLVEGTGLNSSEAYASAKSALWELANVQWQFEDAENEEWYYRPLLDATKKLRVGIKKGIITVILNPELAPYFVQIAGQYSLYTLDGYMGLHSWYSMRFFEILSAFRDKGWWQVGLDEYRLLMDCGPELDKRGEPKKKKDGTVKVKLADTNTLINKTVLTAQKELQATPYAFDFYPVRETQRSGPGRLKIVGLRFELQRKLLTEIPAAWLEDASTAAVIKSLREFRVSDKNIAQYLKPLTLAGARKLVYDWRIKQNSSNRIDDVVKYCNAAFVRQAKAEMEKYKQETLEAKKFVQQLLFDNPSTDKK